VGVTPWRAGCDTLSTTFQPFVSRLEHRVSECPEQIASGIGRRELLGGGLVLGGFLLVGCQSNSSADLPGPRWPSTRDDGGIIVSKPVTPTLPPVVSQPDSQPMPGVIARSQWTRSGVARPREINPMNGISRLTVHHSAINSSELRTPAAVARELDGIRAGHVGRGWADIGYHYIIDPSGKVWQGRSIQYQGAHVENNNEHNLGIMLLGNFNQQTPTPQSIATLNSFVAAQMRQYRIPVARVYTHRELKSTECPGTTLQRYMVQARSRGGALSA